MPPKKAATPQPKAATMSAAANYRSPIKFELPKTRKEMPTKRQTEETWEGAVIKIGQEWLQFAGVNWKKQTPLESLVLFADGADPTTPRARLALKVLLDATTRATACSTIILGALGGTFVSKEGLRIRMKALNRGRNKGAFSAEYALLDHEDEELLDEEPMDMSEFSAAFGAPVSARAETVTEEFDFGPYPSLLAMIRTVGLLGQDEARTTVKTAVEFLTGLQGRDEVDPSELATVAAAAETAAQHEKASPELSRLKRAATGALSSQPPSKRGKIVRALGLQLAQVDDLPMPAPAGGGKGKRSQQPAAKKGQQAAERPTEPEAGGAPAYRIPKRATGGRPAEAAAPEDPEEDDSDSGESDEEDEALEAGGAGAQPEAARPAPSNKRKRAATAETARDAELFDAPPESTPLLTSLTPPGMGQLAAARIIFSAPQMCEAAGAEPLGSEALPPGEGQRMAKRYDLALGRLKRYLGQDWEPVVGASVDKMAGPTELEDLAELLLDAVMSTRLGQTVRQTGGGTSQQQQRGSSRSSSGAADAGEKEQHTKEPSKGLSADKCACAVLPGTAEYLHSNKSKIAEATADKQPGSIVSLISASPTELRENLRAALMSNGAVDNAGETAPSRLALPPAVIDATRVVVGQVERAIEAVPKADVTGQLRLDFTVIQELARKTTDGRGSWEEFRAVAAKMSASRGKTTDERQRIVEVWSLVKPAYETFTKAIGITDRGIATMDTRMTAPETQTRVGPKELETWAGTVLSAYVNRMYKFRHDPTHAPLPMFSDAIADREGVFQFNAYKAALAAQMAAQPPNNRSYSNRGGGKGEKTRSAEGGGGKGKGRGAGGRASPKPPEATQAAGWVERKVTLQGEKFTALRQAAMQKYPDYCGAYLVAKCTRKECPRKHNPRPDDWETFIDEQGLKIDGSEKCESPHPLASSGEPRQPPAGASERAETGERESREPSETPSDAAGREKLCAAQEEAERRSERRKQQRPAESSSEQAPDPSRAESPALPLSNSGREHTVSDTAASSPDQPPSAQAPGPGEQPASSPEQPLGAQASRSGAQPPAQPGGSSTADHESVLRGAASEVTGPSIASSTERSPTSRQRPATPGERSQEQASSVAQASSVSVEFPRERSVDAAQR